MPRFEHPLQLFTLEYPDGWDVRYQEETGGVIFVQPEDESATALSLSPLAVTGEGASLAAEVIQAASRMNVTVTPEAVRVTEEPELAIAYAEGARADSASLGTLYRFWVIRHGPLALYAAQLGPGTPHPAGRRAADAMLASLSFPEIMPPTPEEFRSRVMEILAREYPSYQSSPNGEWAIDLVEAGGQQIGTVGLENLYRACLLNAEVTGVMIRDYLDQVLSSVSERPEYDQYDAVRGRLMPMLKSEEWVRDVSARLELLQVEFAPGLIMCFAVDEPTRMAYVTRDMLQSWDVPLERIQEVAQDNLARKETSLEMTVLNGADDRPFALVINTQDGYDATRLVVPSIRESFAEELGDEYLVGLPNRDFLIAFSQRDPEMTAGIVRQVKHDYHQMNHPLSSAIYRVRADTVEATEL